MTTAEVLRAARDLMNHGGRRWIKGSFRKKNQEGVTCYCAIGAITEATKHLPKDEKQPIRTAAIKALFESVRLTEVGDELDRHYWNNRGRTHGGRRQLVIAFNDHSNRTWPEVRDVFTKAAKLASRKTAA